MKKPIKVIRVDNLPREYPYKVGDTCGDWELVYLGYNSGAWWENSFLKVRVLFKLNEGDHYVNAFIVDYSTDYDGRKVGEFTMADYRNTLSAWAVDSLFHPEDPIDLGTDFSNNEVVTTWFLKNRDKFSLTCHHDKIIIREGLRFILSEFASDELERTGVT